jgi:hypothetical protein
LRIAMPMLLTVLVLAACQGGITTAGGVASDTGGLTACEAAMKIAADVDSMHDAITDLDPAIQQCESIAEFERAVRKFPAALDGADARVFLAFRCDSPPSVALEAVCQELNRP